MALFFLIILSFFLYVAPACAKKITCSQITDVLAEAPDLSVQIFCKTAEARCKALEMMERLPPNDPLRQPLEPKLRAQVEYELEVCAVAVNHAKTFR
jgi:hypothetical protein